MKVNTLRGIGAASWWLENWYIGSRMAGNFRKLKAFQDKMERVLGNCLGIEIGMTTVNSAGWVP